MAWQDRDYYREGPAKWGATSVTLWLITLNCVVYIADSLLGSSRYASRSRGSGLLALFLF